MEQAAKGAHATRHSRPCRRRPLRDPPRPRAAAVSRRGGRELGHPRDRRLRRRPRSRQRCPCRSWSCAASTRAGKHVCVPVCHGLRRSGPSPPYHEGSKRPTPHNPLHIYSCGYCKGGAESKRAATKRTSVSFGLSTCRLLCQDYQALIDLGWRRSGTCGVDLRQPLRIGLSDRVHPSIN